jgi:D-serine deaminase-like pyridoxal phosphate-dependent protein
VALATQGLGEYMTSALAKAREQERFCKGTSKSAQRRADQRERGTLYVGGKPGYEFNIGKVAYRVARDGSFRKVA